MKFEISWVKVMMQVKESKVLVRMVSNKEECELFQSLVQEYLYAGWNIISTEHTQCSIMIVLERYTVEYNDRRK